MKGGQYKINNIKYSRQQMSAINHLKGPCLCVAGPGSGKTAVVTGRTAKLIESGIPADNILVVTFTKAAAEEMARRFQAMNTDGSGMVTFGTFHSIFFKILRFAYNLNSSNILKTTESFQILSRICGSFGVETGGNNEILEGIKAEIGKVKAMGINPSGYFAVSAEPDAFRRIFAAYDKEVKKRRLFDFDDMLTECFRLLTARPDILNQWRDKYKYIMIDEFQDINKIQYETIKLLGGDEANLFVVGDDDQSIYGFRGSNPEIMQTFLEDYKEAKIIKLTVNHRSGQEIVMGAGRLIGNNRKRFEKEIEAFRKDRASIVKQCFDAPKEEAEFIADKIGEFHGRGVPYSEMAVLSRTASGLHHVLGAVSKTNIPFAMKELFTSLYNCAVAKDIIAYIRCGCDRINEEDFVRIMNKPNRYVPRNVIPEGALSMEKIRRTMYKQGYSGERAEKFEYELKFIGRCMPKAAIVYIRRAVGYEDYILEYCKSRGRHPDEVLEELDRLQEDAEGYTTHEEWLKHIETVEKNLKAQAEAPKNRKKDEVVLSTIHGSKGLEYQVVFITGANEGVIPYKRSVSDEAIEEERRLFYVAMTRAKSRLFITRSEKADGKPCKESRFLKEM